MCNYIVCFLINNIPKSLKNKYLYFTIKCIITIIDVTIWLRDNDYNEKICMNNIIS